MQAPEIALYTVEVDYTRVNCETPLIVWSLEKRGHLEFKMQKQKRHKSFDPPIQQRKHLNLE